MARIRANSYVLLYIVNDASFFLSHRLPIALAASKDGYTVVVATPMSKDVHVIKDNGLRHVSLMMTRSGTNYIKELMSLIHVMYLMLIIRPHIVHLVTIKPVLYGGFWARIFKVPAVFAISGLGFLFSETENRKTWSRKLAEMMYRFIFKHANSKVILQNTSDLEILRKIGALQKNQEILVKGSGVDLNVYHPSPLTNNARVVVLPARMLWEKGVGEFVAAAKILKARNIQVQMVLAGPCDPENPTAVSLSQLEQWQMEGSVDWWGYNQDMVKVYNASHLVVLPSFYREGMPKSLLEAAACGRAIVTTDLPGCRDTVDPGKSGLVVPPKDPDTLAQAIAEIINDFDKLESMGAAGRAKAEAEFDVNMVIKTHLEIYRSLLSTQCPESAH